MDFVLNFISIIVFCFGLCVGSFLNVVIYRLPLHMSVSKGFSLCTSCGHRLNAADLVPVFSWLGLRGRCRYCGERISPRYMGVELLTAFLWLLAWLRAADGVLAAGPAQVKAILSVLALLTVISALIAVVFIDARHMIIPNELVLIILAAGILLCFVSEEPGLTERLIGFVAVSGPLLLLALLSGGRAMGLGDIKLMAAAGLCLGWPATVAAFFLGALLGSLVSVTVAAVKKQRLGGRIPFGPYLAGGIILCLFFGREIVGFYLSFF
jgi:leader peptidase (prepilin peptidase)/N-methyltransferase